MVMPVQLCRYDGDNVLLVEGSNDCHVVMALCAYYRLPDTFGIYDCGNDDQVLKRLNALIIRPEAPKKIGILLDADVRIDGRWESIKSKLRNHNYILPPNPEPNGTIIQIDHLPRIGIWLMPNNQINGMIEDFCFEMIEPGAREYVSNCVTSAQNEGVCTFKQAHFSKACVHTFLAWQDEPGFPLGKAITANLLRPNTRTAQMFIDWLNRLFNVD